MKREAGKRLVVGVPSIIENGVGRDILKSGLATLAPESEPGREVFILDSQGTSFISGIIGLRALIEAGVLWSSELS